jgi:NADH-quinone oxidoreductase subunit G
MVKLTVNTQTVEVAPGSTIFQACEKAGIEIPHFCYHPRLSVAGNCRMCLVEVEKNSKPVASCHMPVSEGMVVHTNTPMVEKARQGVLEFLLINHPLDCPICDQGGECDLQDLTLHYGPGDSRFELNKRAVTNKYMGPLIKTVMNRCIHCTRCIRFSNEIGGVQELGALGRGEHTEIISYLEGAVSSELSGNMIDICPVGALTNKPYAFHGRPWELTKTDSIDVMDAVGSHIRVDTKNNEVMRILPRLKEDINEEWISDRTRFAYDGLKRQRLDKPYMRKNGKLVPCSFEEAFQAIQEKIQKTDASKIGALAGPFADCESMLLMGKLMRTLGSNRMDCRPLGSFLSFGSRSHYIFNTTIQGLEKADCILLVGTNPRLEAPMLNARIRKNYFHTRLPIGLIGEMADLNYTYHHLGVSFSALGEESPFYGCLSKSKYPVVIFGQSVFEREDSANLFAHINKFVSSYPFIQPQWCGYNVLHTHASHVGGLDLGFVCEHEHGDTILRNSEVLFLLGMDDPKLAEAKDAFCVYLGHHGDVGAHHAHVVLPGCAYTEKEATYVNTEGRPQRTNRAIVPPGQARNDWEILKDLGQYLGHDVVTASLPEMLAAENPIFQTMGNIVPTPWVPLIENGHHDLKETPLRSTVHNFYMNDVISRHSTNMANCVKEILHNQKPEVFL